MAASYTISDLAAEFDITTRTIRFYEEKGLLQPRRQGSVRVYTPADRTKLKLILRGKRLGFSLDESRSIIEMYDPAHGNTDQYNSLLAKIREKRHQLEQQLHDIEVMMLELREAEDKALEAMAASSGKKTGKGAGR
ncbi:MerR family transcriptional regulator [Haliea sp. E17]|uniref:MerR family transcriptional regulator n=1 Tax=Haliea sp. E17 TaxID=3401576 RepID=UPI003AAC9C6D